MKKFLLSLLAISLIPTSSFAEIQTPSYWPEPESTPTITTRLHTPEYCSAELIKCVIENGFEEICYEDYLYCENSRVEEYEVDPSDEPAEIFEPPMIP